MRVYVIESRSIIRAALQTLLAGLPDCEVLEASDDAGTCLERVLRLVIRFERGANLGVRRRLGGLRPDMSVVSLSAG